ncbi:MAG: M18 family aminopeptidase, partial [Microbacteriaceae bacterium]|nr:M18 family aminopeptidase [Microbacteriaceae bacterium]
MSDSMAHLHDLAAFVCACPSSFHAVDEAARRLSDAGFAELDETDHWERGAGKRFLVRDGAIIAWIEPASAT